MSEAYHNSKKPDDTIEDHSGKMEELWSTSPAQVPKAEATSAVVPPCSTPESNGAAPKRAANNALACVEVSKKGRRNRSPYWAYFDKVLVDGLQRAACKYCSRQIGCDPRYGTSVLKNHIERCKGSPPKLNPDEVFEICSRLPPTPATHIPTTTIVPWDKFPAAVTVYQMMDTMERLKQDPFAYGSSSWSSGPGAEGNGYRTVRTPWAIRETEVSYKMRFDMPGMTKNDVNVWVEENMLVVEAEKVPKRCKDGQVDIAAVDREWPVESYGKYNSRIALPATVTAENVKAEVKDGVLYITIPKVRATGKRIDINVQ